MKILVLDLIAYGPFAGARLDLSEGAEGLHILYGPNEAGKSSMLRALDALLFGMETRTLRAVVSGPFHESADPNRAVPPYTRRPCPSQCWLRSSRLRIFP